QRTGGGQSRTLESAEDQDQHASGGASALRSTLILAFAASSCSHYRCILSRSVVTTGCSAWTTKMRVPPPPTPPAGSGRKSEERTESDGSTAPSSIQRNPVVGFSASWMTMRSPGCTTTDFASSASVSNSSAIVEVLHCRIRPEKPSLPGREVRKGTGLRQRPRPPAGAAGA